MTTPQLAFDIRGLLPSLSGWGVSEDAAWLRAQLDGLFRARLESITMGKSYLDAMESLEDVFQECSSENWDGYGARVVDGLTYVHARKFLEALPTTLPAPEVAAEPDGEIAFEWHIGPRWVFSVSVGRENELTYAGLFGRSTAHGTEDYFADEIPSAIMENLDRLFSKEAEQRSSS